MYNFWVLYISLNRCIIIGGWYFGWNISFRNTDNLRYFQLCQRNGLFLNVHNASSFIDENIDIVFPNTITNFLAIDLYILTNIYDIIFWLSSYTSKRVVLWYNVVRLHQQNTWKWMTWMTEDGKGMRKLYC